MATAQAILAQREVTAPWFSAVRPRGCELAARRWDQKEDGRLPGPIVFRLPPLAHLPRVHSAQELQRPTTSTSPCSRSPATSLSWASSKEEDGSEEAPRGKEGELEEGHHSPPPATRTRLASHRTGPWGSQDLTDTLIVSTPPSPTEIANATSATPAPAAAAETPTAATPTVTLDPDLYVINTLPASRSGSRHPSPFTRSPLLRGPGHLDEEGYGFHRIVKAKKTDETTKTATTDTPSAFTTPIVVGNLPEEVTEEMMMEDIRAATGIRVRAQAAGPPTSGPSASSTDGLNPDQLREHAAAREAQSAGRHSPTFTEEFERRLAGRHSPSFSEEFE